MPLEVREAQKLAIETNDPLIPCPCCRTWVDKLSARSIFDFDVKICRGCAFDEKAMPNFNWIKENAMSML